MDMHPWHASALLVSMLTAFACGCSGESCHTGPLVGGPNLYAAGCPNSHARLEVTGESCTLGTPLSCTYAVSGNVVTFAINVEKCTTEGTHSAGCGDAKASCAGPTLAVGTYVIEGQLGKKLVVEPAGCALQ